jgi:hypothetical protein
MTYFIIFLSQLLFNFLKVLEIKFTYENKVGKLLINSVLINSVSLIGFYYSLDLLLNEGDYIVGVFYISGSVMGKFIAMKYDNPGKVLLNTILNKKSK